MTCPLSAYKHNKIRSKVSMVANQMVYIEFVHLFYYLSFINSNIYSSFSLSLVVLQQGFLSGFNGELLTVFLTNDLHCNREA
jgi:hypothetical protein